MSETVVKVENVSKRFCRDLKRSLWYGMKDIAAELTGRKSKITGGLRRDEFWAVKDVSFELKRGECLGLIGHNGAGKSTLLKMLNGLIKPDQGRIVTNGRVSALIELGAGFNPILTGRENIYINGQVLGFSKREVDEKFEDIVDFSELREFIDTPVQNYSSGMKVRLGFAVASQMEPDILILDEVLAVGDMSFAMKSFNAISRIRKKAAVIFVSHSMPFISRVSDIVMLMDKGKVSLHSRDVGLGIQTYFNIQKFSESTDFGSGIIRLNEIQLFGGNVDRNGLISYGQDVTLKININSNRELQHSKVVVLVYNMAQFNVALFETREISIKREDDQRFTFNFGTPFLSVSKYFITLRIDSYDGGNVEAIANFVNCRAFQVTGDERLVFAPLYLKEKS